ncbi:MAG: CocE/NonD family hydrolase [Chloroflexi bacterium]|nr:CocE/NonD family hydrolase [Chloroflexota bacterium]
MGSSVRVDRDVPIRMRDGVVLRADVYRPDDNEKHPAVVSRTPHGKLGATRFEFFPLLEAVFAGYAVVLQDVRGRGTSEGEYADDGALDSVDGYDTIEHIAAEPWCDGNVGMQGASAAGMTIWLAAMENPPHLKAIAPQQYPGKPIGGLEPCGNIHLARTIMILTNAGFDMARRLEKQGKDVSEMRRMLQRAAFDPEEAYNYLPLKSIPYFNFPELMGIVRGRLNDKLVLSRWHCEKVSVPCLHTGSWYDLFASEDLETYLCMRQKAASERARAEQYLIFGPWTHVNLTQVAGELHFGPVASGQAALIAEKHIQFFNKHLRGMEVKLPRVQYFVMGRNTWHDAEEWPLPQVQWQRFFLHSGGRANTSSGDGLLSRQEPGAEPPDIFVYNPHFPVPTRGGVHAPHFRVSVPGPADQSLIERRGDVLCYTTPELDKEVEVVGPIRLHLFAATSVRDTDFSAKLVDVYPDGSAYNLTQGMIRARYRESLTHPELVNPGDVNEYVIDMGATGNLFRRGHRIRIDIASSNFPVFDRNMNTGNPLGEDAEGIPALQTIFHQPGLASRVDLPVIPR